MQNIIFMSSLFQSQVSVLKLTFFEKVSLLAMTLFSNAQYQVLSRILFLWIPGWILKQMLLVQVYLVTFISPNFYVSVKEYVIVVVVVSI